MKEISHDGEHCIPAFIFPLYSVTKANPEKQKEDSEVHRKNRNVSKNNTLNTWII